MSLFKLELAARITGFTVVATLAVAILMISPVMAIETKSDDSDINVVKKSYNFSKSDDKWMFHWICRLKNNSSSEKQFDLRVFAALKNEKNSQNGSEQKEITLAGGEQRVFRGQFLLSKPEMDIGVQDVVIKVPGR